MRNNRLAGIQNADVVVDIAGDIRGHTFLGVAHDKYIDLHRLQRVDHVQNAFALFSRRGVHVQVQDIGSEAFGSQIEGGPRTRAGFEKKVGNRFATQRVTTYNRRANVAQEGLRPVQQCRNLVTVEALDCQQVPEATGSITLLVGFPLRTAIAY
jgi:hypothetical protein